MRRSKREQLKTLIRDVVYDEMHHILIQMDILSFSGPREFSAWETIEWPHSKRAASRLITRARRIAQDEIRRASNETAEKLAPGQETADSPVTVYVDGKPVDVPPLPEKTPEIDAMLKNGLDRYLQYLDSDVKATAGMPQGMLRNRRAVELHGDIEHARHMPLTEGQQDQLWNTTKRLLVDVFGIPEETISRPE